MAGLNPDQFLELYKLTVEEDHLFSKIYHDRTVFYQGILAALLAVTGAGFTTAEAVHEYVFLIVGSASALAGLTGCHQGGVQGLPANPFDHYGAGQDRARTGNDNASDGDQACRFILAIGTLCS